MSQSQAGRGRKGSVLGSLEKVQKMHEESAAGDHEGVGGATKRLILIDDDDDEDDEDSADDDAHGHHRGYRKHGKGSKGMLVAKEGGPEVIESLLPFEKTFSPSFFLTLIHGRFVTHTHTCNHYTHFSTQIYLLLLAL